jgi:hypothetical protein
MVEIVPGMFPRLRSIVWWIRNEDPKADVERNADPRHNGGSHNGTNQRGIGSEILGESPAHAGDYVIGPAPVELPLLLHIAPYLLLIG